MSDKLLVDLGPHMKQQLRREAKRRGMPMSALTKKVLREYLDEIEAQEEFSRWLERVRGSAPPGMTTDEIMALTRGE